MMQLTLKPPSSAALQILCLGCHSDDIEIGCGGAILRLREQYPNCIIHWVVLSAAGIREAEALRGAELFAGRNQPQPPRLKNFPDGRMPFAGSEIKAFFEELKTAISPDLIFTHNRQDAHQDHQFIAELTWQTFRNHLILEYEIPKYDGDLGRPSVFVPLEREVCQKKVAGILECFASQRGKHWFQEDTFFALLRLRGMECNSPSGYAEAFYSRKIVL